MNSLIILTLAGRQQENLEALKSAVAKRPGWNINMAGTAYQPRFVINVPTSYFDDQYSQFQISGSLQQAETDKTKLRYTVTGGFRPSLHGTFKFVMGSLSLALSASIIIPGEISPDKRIAGAVLIWMAGLVFVYASLQRTHEQRLKALNKVMKTFVEQMGASISG